MTTNTLAHTATHTLPGKEPTMDPRADVDALVRSLTDRQRTILAERLAAADPKTLDALGQQFGVSRERVRQIEADLRTKLTRFPWVVLMSGVVPVHGSWVRSVPQILLTPTGETWVTPIAGGPSLLHLLVAAGEIENLGGDWVGRRMLGSNAQPGRLVELITRGMSGTCPEDEYLAQLADLGLADDWARQFLTDHDLVIRHGFVHSGHETLAEFLLLEMAAAKEPVSLDTVAEWIDGRWTIMSAKNVLQGDPRFMRVDVQRYALADAGLPPYRGIREEINALVTEHGPLALGDVVDAICGAFDVEPASVEHYAKERPFKVTDGVVDFRQPSLSTSRGTRGPLALADIPEGRQWRHVFFTPTGFAYRLTVTADHLRGSGSGTGLAVARIVGLAQGRVWERPLDNVDAGLKISRNLQRQPALGSIKKALDAQGAQVGDTAFIRFHGTEGAIDRVSLTVERRTTTSRDLFAEALMLVGCDRDVDDPFDAICAALGVDADFAAELVDVATGRRDEALAAVLTEIASL